MKTPVLVLLLLCTFSLFPLTVRAQQTSSEDLPTFVVVPLSSGTHNEFRVLYNVSDTGILSVECPLTVVMSDHHGDITVSYNFGSWYVINLTVLPRRVVFKLGILEPFCYIPESSQMFVNEYFLEDLPKNADMISLAKLFGCRQGQTAYDSGFDLDSNTIINMRDIAIAVQNFQQIQARIP